MNNNDAINGAKSKSAPMLVFYWHIICNDNNHSFIWFYRDIEEVFLHKSVDNTNKEDVEAKKFSNLPKLGKVDEKSLSFDKKIRYKSNILIVLDKYLTRKWLIVKK